MKKNVFLLILLACLFCGNTVVQAQVMKAADLEKYAKQKYGDKWLDAAKNLASTLTLDKNESLTYQQVIEAPGKTKQQLYVALNYWATATFKDNIAEHMGTISKYSVSITPIIRLDIKDGKIRVTYTVQNYDILDDISGGWFGIATDDKNRSYADAKRKADDKTNPNLWDEQWEIARHYPFVEKDSKKRTCAKALVMTHAYSNAIMDKVEEAVKNGIVGNDDDEW